MRSKVFNTLGRTTALKTRPLYPRPSTKFETFIPEKKSFTKKDATLPFKYKVIALDAESKVTAMRAVVPEIQRSTNLSVGLQREIPSTPVHTRKANISALDGDFEKGSSSIKSAGPIAVRSLINKGIHLPTEQCRGLSQTDNEKDPKFSTKDEFNGDMKGSGVKNPGIEDSIQENNEVEGILLLCKFDPIG